MPTVKEKSIIFRRSSPEWRWQAVLARDGHFDGSFVYAVHSTCVYCRPSCSSRRPKREYVVFFSGPEEAEQAGFRPCRRCRPDQQFVVNRQLEIVNLVCHSIQEHQDGSLTLAQLGERVGASPGHVQRVFKRLVGITPRQYADACRQDRFKTRLQEGLDITTAMYDAGYGSTSRLYERSTERFGMSPASYRRGGRGARITYTTVTCPFGRLLVAATERGLCAVKLGDADTDLLVALKSEFPWAEFYQDDGALGQWVGVLLWHLRGELTDIEVPLDVQATAFQRQVWEHLRTIPYGDTRSYRQVAEALGRPTAARAVARACGANPVPLVVPCHRAIRRDGGLGGYRWGLERKAALLDFERASRQAGKQWLRENSSPAWHWPPYNH